MLKISISNRITLWSVILVVLIIFISGLWSIFYVNMRLTNELVDRLSSEAIDISRSLSFLDSELIVTEDIEWGESHHSGDDENPIYIIILNARGQEVRRSDNCLNREIAVGELLFARDDQEASELVLNGERWQFLTSPMHFFDEFYGWIVVGMAFTTIEHILAVLLQIYLVGLPIMIGLALVGSSALAHRVLDPIRKMSQKAREIQALNASQRLPQPNTKDEIEHLSQTLNSMLDRIQSNMDIIRRFSANASHELKTPVTIINSRMEQLLAGSEDLDVESVNEIRLEIKRISQIVDDLAILAKMDSDSIHLTQNKIWIADIIYDEIARFEKLAREKNIRIEPRGMESRVINGDEYWLRVMISNLIDNAIKYSPSGTTIEIGMENDGNGARITIDDEGPGVAGDELSYLTKRFYRGPGTKAITGSGLGLSIVEWIIKSHEWRLNFSNRENGGLRVAIEMDEAGKVANQ